jgi:hypothetical protein
LRAVYAAAEAIPVEHMAVTTFSPAGYALYGRRFVESFLAYWTIPLVAYYETERPDVSDSRVILRDLDLDDDRATFLERYDRPEFRGRPDDYATQAIRFSHKVFAFTADIPSSGWRIWIDADVETFAPVTSEVLRTICPAHCALSYLGRQNGQHSETGFVACRPEDASVRSMLDELRRTYTSGALFHLDPRQRHDGALFDLARRLVPPETQCNLSADIGETHVWPHTALGTVMHHSKGQARKNATYGGTAS